ncbi:acyl-CoA thioesterase domain-containing protein [Nocardia gamkensis]|uniref:acyl-CoA thioesterase domain-containing protein n=1 Tax=Nocardia gamkensis TaxID=352869 RepID=UPI0036EDEB1E
MSGVMRSSRAPLAIPTAEHLLPRFGIEILDIDENAATMTMSMPLWAKRNPLTGHTAIGSLAILVDAVSGGSNHIRRNSNEWSLSTELTVDLLPGVLATSADMIDTPVIARSWPVGPRSRMALSACEFTINDEIIGSGSARNMYTTAATVDVDRHAEGAPAGVPRDFAGMMAIDIREGAGSATLLQRVDPVLNNAMGVVNGGVAAAGAEMAASAAINVNADLAQTTAMRVNFLCPFRSQEGGHYRAAVVRNGRGVAVAEGSAVNGDGSVAVTALVTAYRC